MEGVLHRDGHPLEHEGGVASQVMGRVPRCQIEVARLIGEHRILRILEIEVLDAGRGERHIALSVKTVDHTVQYLTRIALEGLSIWGPDGTEHPGGAVF